MTLGIVRKVDRILVRTSQPDQLFSVFGQQLLLPEAWPLANNPYYLSGGLHLGNAYLDIVQLGQRNPTAALYGLAFELNNLEASLGELEARGIPHTPPLSFRYVDSQGWQMAAWNYLFLGGLLENHYLHRLFFRRSHRVSSESWEKRSRPSAFNRQYILRFIADMVYRRALVLGIDYNPAWRSGHIREGSTNAGLELVGVYEVTIGTRNLEHAREQWGRLLDPIPEIADAVWRMPGDLHLRLVQHPRNQLLGMVWQVSSLNRAAQFLHRRDLLAAESNQIVAIRPDRIGGLDIRLMQ